MKPTTKLFYAIASVLLSPFAPSIKRLSDKLDKAVRQMDEAIDEINAGSAERKAAADAQREVNAPIDQHVERVRDYLKETDPNAPKLPLVNRKVPESKPTHIGNCTIH